MAHVLFLQIKLIFFLKFGHYLLSYLKVTVETLNLFTICQEVALFQDVL